MSLTESVNNFDTKLNQITTDIFKEVEKILGGSLTADKKKLSNLIPFLRSVSSTIAELEQTKKELEKTVKGFQERGDALCASATERTGKRFSKIIKPNDLNSLYVYMENGDYCYDWANKNTDNVWRYVIYPKLSDTGSWRTTLNGRYVMTCAKTVVNGELVPNIYALERPQEDPDISVYASQKKIMTID